MKKYILTGNNLTLEMKNNISRLTLIGKSNRVKIVQNEGKIQLVGLDNVIEIEDNLGTVEVIGACDSIKIDGSSAAKILDFDHIIIKPNVTEPELYNNSHQRHIITIYENCSHNGKLKNSYVPMKNCCVVS